MSKQRENSIFTIKRNSAIELLAKVGGYSVIEIAEMFKITRAYVYKVIKK